MEKRSERTENKVCRYWLQIESCRECLFDALCTYEDNNERTGNKRWTWGDN